MTSRDVPLIVAAAIKRPDGDLIFTMPKPARHSDILRAMSCDEHIDALDVVQGFLDEEGTFLNRFQAKSVAVFNNQMLRQSGCSDLFTEDLW